MDRAEELFAQLRTDGTAAIDRLIADKSAEELFLEFKTSRDSGPAGALGNDDSSNLARAISGFGNSDGGVLVWGIDCRKRSGVETITKAPLNNADGFRKRIESAISRTTSPVHPGVQNIAIPSGTNDEGFVVTLIPRAEFVPIRAITRGDDRYFIRAGDSFVPTPHAVLEGLFGRRPIGKVRIQLISNPIRLQAGGTGIPFTIGVSIANGGVTLLERPYVAVHPGNLFTSGILRIQPTDQPAFVAKKSQLGNWQIYANDQIVIVPGGVQDMCTISFVVMNNTPALPSDAIVEVTAGAANAPPRRFLVSCDQHAFNGALATVRGGGRIDTGELFQLNRVSEQQRLLA